MSHGRRLGIVGSRTFRRLDWVDAFVDLLPLHVVVVSGGAAGVDLRAETRAIRRGMEVVSYAADWKGLGKSAGFARNATIVDNCDQLVAFWDGQSRGTEHTIGLAQRAGKLARVVLPG